MALLKFSKTIIMCLSISAAPGIGRFNYSQSVSEISVIGARVTRSARTIKDIVVVNLMGKKGKGFQRAYTITKGSVLALGDNMSERKREGEEQSRTKTQDASVKLSLSRHLYRVS